MEEHPIIFSGSMVRAILEDRKTMTRRPLRVQPNHKYARFADYKTDLGYPKSKGSLWAGFYLGPESQTPGYFKCPYGQVGDRLWVREPWKCSAMSHHTPTNGPELVQYSISYKPNGCFPNCKTVKMEKPVDNAWQKNRDGWRPSIHLPRWASRITLETTNIRVERVQEITEEDAEREGMDGHCPMDKMTWSTPREQFVKLWDSIHGKGAWDRNDFCWVISFKRIK